MHHFVNFSLLVLALTLFCSNFGGITARRAAVARNDSDAFAHKAPSAEAAEVVAAAESVRGMDVPKEKETDAGSNPKEEVNEPHDKYDKVQRDKIEHVHVPRPEESTKKPDNHALVRRAIIDEAGTLPAKSEVGHADDSTLHEAPVPAVGMHADNPAVQKAHEPTKEVHENNHPAALAPHEPAKEVHPNNPAALEAHGPTGKLSATANQEAHENVVVKVHPNNAGQLDKSADGVGQLDLAGKSEKVDEVGKISPSGGAEEKDKTIKVKGDDIIERKDAVLSQALHKDASPNATPKLVKLEGKEVPENKRRILPMQKLDGDSDNSAPGGPTTMATPSNEAGGMTLDAGNTTTDKSDNSTSSPPNGQMNNSRDAASTLLVTVFSYFLASGSVLCYLDNFGLRV